MEYLKWIDEITGGASHRDIYRKLGELSPATVGRNIRLRDPKFAITLARLYDTNPIEGLIAIGFITRQDAINFALENEIGLDQYSDVDLARAVVERLEQKRGNGVIPLWDPLTAPLEYAADSSDTEPELGDEDYNDGP